MAEQLPDRRRWFTPTETPADEHRNAIQGAEQELERLRSRLEPELEDALDQIRTRDYAAASAMLDGVEYMAEHLAALEEKISEQRQTLEPPE